VLRGAGDYIARQHIRRVLVEFHPHISGHKSCKAAHRLLVAAGYTPVITHPERLTWIEDHYPAFTRMVHSGAWIQLTAGSVTGRFGRRPKYWAERILDEGQCHIIATDSHHIDRRPPLLAEARDAAAKRLGEPEAQHLVVTRPQGILDNIPPGALPPLPSPVRKVSDKKGFWRTLIARKN